MQALIDAIVAAFADTALSEAVSGLYYRGGTPQPAPTTVQMPYVTFFLVGNVPDNAGSQKCEEPRVQFSIWTSGWDSTEAMALYPLLRAIYDDALLSVSGYSMITMDRVADNLIPDPGGGWQYAIDYNVMIQEV